MQSPPAERTLTPPAEMPPTPTSPHTPLNWSPCSASTLGAVSPLWGLLGLASPLSEGPSQTISPPGSPDTQITSPGRDSRLATPPVVSDPPELEEDHPLQTNVVLTAGKEGVTYIAPTSRKYASQGPRRLNVPAGRWRVLILRGKRLAKTSVGTRREAQIFWLERLPQGDHLPPRARPRHHNSLPSRLICTGPPPPSLKTLDPLPGWNVIPLEEPVIRPELTWRPERAAPTLIPAPTCLDLVDPRGFPDAQERARDQDRLLQLMAEVQAITMKWIQRK